jgi:hypothetical protein|tara:strand:- start:8980 stop:10362 length:1383 start_codon:yes stop_codon:yes gene_type:complete
MLLHDNQLKIFKHKARFKIIRAGRRSGKSTLCIEIMLLKAVSKKDQQIFYVSPNQKQSRSIVWEVAKSRLKGQGKINESRMEIELPTKDGGVSRIFIAGFETRESFRGLKADLIVFDETDSMPDFFIGWQEIFRPALTDTAGKAIFIGTPKKENPNLRRLEKIAQEDDDYTAFHFKTEDNPYIPIEEIAKAEKELDYDTYKQEFLAEYLDTAGALFNYDALIDVFSNTVTKQDSKYLIVDIAGDGSDKTIFSFWEGLEEYRREVFERMDTEGVVNKIREYASQDQIPFSQIAVDAIGIGEGVASSSMLDGIKGYKSSYQAIKTDINIVHLPNVGYTKGIPLSSDYKNLRSQCVFILADLVNNHKIASKVDGQFKEYTIEELSNYQDVSQGDGKRMATMSEDVKAIIGRSPDHASTWIMRMYFEIMGKMLPSQSADTALIHSKQQEQFRMNQNNQIVNSNK